MSNEELVREAYKELRNHLRNLDLVDSLPVIWAYSRFFSMDIPFPEDVNPVGVLFEEPLNKYKYVSPWGLESLTREVIINANYNTPSKSLNDPKYFANSINKLKNFSDYVSSLYINDTNIRQEVFFRLPHLQFTYQTGFSKEYAMSYYKIFSDSELSKIIKAKVGIPYDRFFFAGFATWGQFLTYSNIVEPISIEIPLKRSELDVFFSVVCSDLDTTKEALIRSRKFDDSYEYSYNPLRGKPIIILNKLGREYMYCPLLPLLFWRFTSGVYYEVVAEKGFGRAFGYSFQNYVGEVLKRRLAKSFRVLGEETYNKPGKGECSTTDWRIQQNNGSVVFIECKTKRLTYLAKSNLDDENIESQYKYLAKMVIQTYKSIEDFKNGFYPNEKYVSKNNIYPVITLLEDWYNIAHDEHLHAIVAKMINDSDLSDEILEKMPYTICTAEELSLLGGLINSYGIDNVFSRIHKPNYLGCAVSVILSREFRAEIKVVAPLFEDEFNSKIAGYIGKTAAQM